MRTHQEVDALIELTRTYYAECAAYRAAGANGSLSPAAELEFQHRLQGMDERIEQLKSNNELERCRGERVANIIPIQFGKKAAR